MITFILATFFKRFFFTYIILVPLWLLLDYQLLRVLYVLNNGRKVAQGIGDWYVVVAPSGKGTVYHHKSCKRVRAVTAIPLSDAQDMGYHPCSSCGGRHFYMKY